VPAGRDELVTSSRDSLRAIETPTARP